MIYFIFILKKKKKKRKKEKKRKKKHFSTSIFLSVGDDLAKTFKLGITRSNWASVNLLNLTPSITIPPVVKIPHFLAIFLAVTMSFFIKKN